MTDTPSDREQPEPVAWPSREDLARLIDPKGYDAFDRVVEYQSRPQGEAPWSKYWHDLAWFSKNATDAALSKADAIAALYTQPSEQPEPVADDAGVPGGVWKNPIYEAADQARNRYLRDEDTNDQMGALVAAVDAALSLYAQRKQTGGGGGGVQEVIEIIEALTRGPRNDDFDRGAWAARMDALDMLRPLATNEVGG